MQRMRSFPATLAILTGIVAAPAFAQAPPSFVPGQLDQFVARIALYPDPLVAQILAAATYPNDIPAAAQWADQHHYLTGQPLADAIAARQMAEAGPDEMAQMLATLKERRQQGWGLLLAADWLLANTMTSWAYVQFSVPLLLAGLGLMSVIRGLRDQSEQLQEDHRAAH